MKPPRWPIGKHKAIPERGISQSTCVKYDVRTYNYEILFPYFHKGQARAVEVRNNLYHKRQPGHFTTTGNNQGLFFGMQAVHTKRVLAITFGCYDALSIFQATGVACLSVSDSKLIKALKHNYEWLMAFEELIIVPDNDSSCRKAIEAADELWPANTKIVSLSHKDANEYSQKKQEDLLTRAFYSALPLAGNLIKSTVRGSITTEQQLVGHLTGTAIDRLLCGFRDGELTSILGAPTVGKTTYTRWLLSRLISSNVKVAVISSEEGPNRYINKLARTMTSCHVLTPDLVQACEEKLDEMTKWYSKYQYDVDKVTRFIAAATKAHNCKVVLIDNISAMSRPEKLNEDIGNYIMALNRLAEEYSCHIIVVSHLSRVNADTEMPDAELMQLGFGSSSIEKYSWNVAILLRKPSEELSIVRVVKNREIGPRGIGSYKLQYNPDTLDFTEYDSKGKTICLNQRTSTQQRTMKPMIDV